MDTLHCSANRCSVLSDTSHNVYSCILSCVTCIYLTSDVTTRYWIFLFELFKGMILWNYFIFTLSGNNYVVYVYCVKDESDENERLGSCSGAMC